MACRVYRLLKLGAIPDQVRSIEQWSNDVHFRPIGDGHDDKVRRSSTHQKPALEPTRLLTPSTLQNSVLKDNQRQPLHIHVHKNTEVDSGSNGHIELGVEIS